MSAKFLNDLSKLSGYINLENDGEESVPGI